MTAGLQKAEATVLGGGISGITTALVLQWLGLQVCVITDQPVQTASGAALRPMVPSYYPMASAYPHNLRVADLKIISRDSQDVFQSLSAIRNSGLALYTMFEVFENEPAEPPLKDERMEFQLFDGRPGSLKKNIDPPVRPGADYLWGWRFKTWFADMPLYLKFLWDLFEESGGRIVSRTLTKDTLAELPSAAPVINCLGLSSRELFDDRGSDVVMRGKQVLVRNAQNHKSIEATAYNYTPTSEVFARADGNPEYVHLFPRSDGFLLGQTREPGIIDEKGNWCGEQVKGEYLTLGSELIPAPVINLNREILSSWRGIEFPDSNMEGRTGYRYYRCPDNKGVRLEADDSSGRLLIHNYGHGGSGVTMSWGCSIRAARLLLAEGVRFSSTSSSPLRRLLYSRVTS